MRPLKTSKRMSWVKSPSPALAGEGPTPFSRPCGRRWREAPDEGLRNFRGPHPDPLPQERERGTIRVADSSRRPRHLASALLEGSGDIGPVDDAGHMEEIVRALTARLGLADKQRRDQLILV